jgi:DNA-binding response OmpR family regulator
MTTSRADTVAVSRPAGPAVRRILLIAGEPAIHSLITPALSTAGYAIECAWTGTGGLQRASEHDYHLVILDLAAPDLDGRAVLKGLLTARPGLAVLVLSCLADVTAKVEFLELGAQDYVTKPFALDELVARVRVQLRGGAARHGEVIRTGGLTLDLWRLQADSGHGPVPLTRLEFMLLRELMEHPGESVPKGRLLASIWGYDFDPHSNVVDVCVRRLRTKLGFELIKTVRGEGYQLTPHHPGMGIQ